MKTALNCLTLAALLGCCALLPAAAQPARPGTTTPAAAAPSALRPGDHIAAVVNQELVTAYEVNQRMARARDEAQRNNQRLPAEAELRRQVLESLIEDRAMLSHARDSGVRVDEPDIDRAVANMAAQNQLTMAQLRTQLTREGLDLARFRANIRDQMLIERVREREVAQRIRITDSDVDEFIEKQRGAAAGEVQYNVAQVLITVPENASDAVVAERRARAEAALARVRGGEAFDKVAIELSEDGNRAKGGEIGLRPASRLPDIFVEATKGLKSGEIAPTLLRSGAGFHVLKLVERKEAALGRVTQTRARHVLLRTSAQLNAETASRRLAEYRKQIEGGSKTFEEIARQLQVSVEFGTDKGSEIIVDPEKTLPDWQPRISFEDGIAMVIDDARRYLAANESQAGATFAN